jgi:hypothetical protein
MLGAIGLVSVIFPLQTPLALRREGILRAACVPVEFRGAGSFGFAVALAGARAAVLHKNLRSIQPALKYHVCSVAKTAAVAQAQRKRTLSRIQST